jgi:hypothetical protein
MPNPKLYVEGQVADLDRLVKGVEAYERVTNGSAISASNSEDERTPNDPFGFAKPKKKTKDHYAEGKEAGRRITQFIGLVASEMGLDPDQVMFGVELAALNTFNAQDCPMSEEHIAKAREDAFDYYARSLREIPDVKKPR